MQKTKINQSSQQVANEMLPEYDLAKKNGVRGKFYKDLQQGHLVRIHEDDGSTTTLYFALQEGAVLLDPDVRAYFPDAAAVNSALRALIATMPPNLVQQKAGTSDSM